ncbi:hypothetical protein NDU88_002411 [Pleurodeles waltl]|uniref:Uncharacterized protein n=1 Tax=Pleurodeles waltl TaxID=8319 RepID=A0AAV7P874_PLEWA|nr:hypothetical protein NDU88_002411 [Pleurodeles waltl]
MGVCRHTIPIHGGPTPRSVPISVGVGAQHRKGDQGPAEQAEKKNCWLPQQHREVLPAEGASAAARGGLPGLLPPLGACGVPGWDQAI